MGKKPEVSLEKRAEINVLLSEGFSQKEIAAKLEISQSAVSKIIKRIIEFGTYTPKPRPGRPRINPDQKSSKSKKDNSFSNIKVENTFNNDPMSLSASYVGAQEEDNFFLSLCEIENSIKKERESSNESSSQNSGFNIGSYHAIKRDPEARSSFEMERNSYGISNTQQDRPSSFVKLEGRMKIKSEFKRPSDVMRHGGKNYSTRIENQRIHHVKTEDRRSQMFIKTEEKPHHVFLPENEIIPRMNIKKEKHYYDDYDHYDNDNHHNDDDDDEDDRNNFYNYKYEIDNDENTFHRNNHQIYNGMSHNNAKVKNNIGNQMVFPSFSRSIHTPSKNKMEYFRIYDKSIKRRPRKSDVQIKPTTFVKISERKRSHEKRRFNSASPLKIRFKKERF